MFKKLRNRLLIMNMVIISIVMTAAFSAIYIITYANEKSENQRKLAAVPFVFSVPAEGVGAPESTVGFEYMPGSATNPESLDEAQGFIITGGRSIGSRLPLDFTSSFSVLVDETGEVLDVSSFLDTSEEFYTTAAFRVLSSNEMSGTLTLESRDWLFRVLSFENITVSRGGAMISAASSSDGAQISFLDVTDSNRTLTQLLFTFAAVGAGMLFIIYFICLHFANRSIRPIEQSWEKQKQFVTDASHELKTPLAVISANTDALLSGENETVASQKKWIGYIRSETERMGRLVNDLLYLAKAEEAKEEQTPLDLSGAVSYLTASFEAAAFEKGISFSQDIESGVIIRGDGDKIRQAAAVLLDNAVKYAGDGGQIAVSLKKTRGQAVFSITNTGEGIPEKDLPFIFDRFYRGDPSRSKETGGYGLGLSIAKAIIERSGGAISAQSADGKTAFTFTLKAL